MKVLVIGANGKVGKLLVRWLINKSHEVKAMIRSEAQAENLKALGAEPVVADLEKEFEFAFKGIDAVVFTAGSGSKTGPDKTMTVDLLGAMKTVDAAVKYGVDRYIMVSAQGAGSPEEKPEAKRYYFVAKAEADKYLRNTRLRYTVFRPGKLTDEPAGKVKLAGIIEERGTTSRDLLAKSIAYSLEAESTFRKTIDILDGEDEVRAAVQQYTF
ncbi:MAG: SDR family oxidoreductase [Bacteroidota bacterium]